METIEALLLKKIAIMQRIKKIDAKTEAAQNRREAPLKTKLAAINTELKAAIQQQKEIVESISSLNESMDSTSQYYGTDFAIYRLEERAIETRGITNKVIAKSVLTEMKKKLSFIVSFNKVYGIEGVCDARDLGKVEEKLAALEQ